MLRVTNKYLKNDYHYMNLFIVHIMASLFKWTSICKEFPSITSILLLLTIVFTLGIQSFRMISKLELFFVYVL